MESRKYSLLFSQEAIDLFTAEANRSITEVLISGIEDPKVIEARKKFHEKADQLLQEKTEITFREPSIEEQRKMEAIRALLDYWGKKDN